MSIVIVKDGKTYKINNSERIIDMNNKTKDQKEKAYKNKVVVSSNNKSIVKSNQEFDQKLTKPQKSHPSQVKSRRADINQMNITRSKIHPATGTKK